MKKLYLFFCLGCISFSNFSQTHLTPEKLWQIGKVSALGITNDKQFVVYTVSVPDIQNNKMVRTKYKMPINGGTAIEITDTNELLKNDRISPDGKYIISSDEVKIKDVTGADFYKDLPKSDVYIYSSLNYRHWDTWEDGKFGHVFVAPLVNGKTGIVKDIMEGEPYDCPQKPSGGDEDFIWSTDSKKILYVAKKSYGTAYAISTNTDLFAYDVEKGRTQNLTEENKGYDQAPAYNSTGDLAYLQMKRDGFEADKQDIMLQLTGGVKMNVTSLRDDIHGEGFKWSEDGHKIFFRAPINGTLQLFSVNNPGLS